MKVDFYRHNLTNIDFKNCLKVLKSLFLTTGPVNLKLENNLRLYFNGMNSATVSSWTAGGHLTLYTLGIKKNDEVITTPLSFVATSNVIEYNNATPIFIDVDKYTGNIDIEKIRSALNSKTKAVLPVHLYGQMVDIQKLRNITPKNILIIEDAAHAFESNFNGIKPGQISNAAIFSFYATKSLTSGEGGAIISSNEKLIEKLRKVRNHGITKSTFERYRKKYEHYDMEFLGFKYNLTDIQASLLLNQLRQAEKLWKRRKLLWEYYDYKITNIKNIDKPRILSNSKHSYYLYTVWVPPRKRDKVLLGLQQKNIGVGVNFRPIHLMRYFKKKYNYKEGDFPNAELIGKRTITLPFYPKLTKVEIDYVCTNLNKLVNY